MLKIKLNENFGNLGHDYLFSQINKRVRAYKEQNPDKRIISLGVGDVTLPLAPCIIAAMQSAVTEMGRAGGFRGYPPENGYDFLKAAIANYYKSEFNVTVPPAEILIGAGAKNDLGALPDIFGGNEILIADPVYPVYADSNILAGRKITYLRATEQNNFLPLPDEVGEIKPYIIYLCSPNNPTGAVYNKKQLKQWVDFARMSGSVIVFDAAYQSFVRGNYPRSIFAIAGARECAIEVNSFSKSCGFTGLRCGFMIVPQKTLRRMWEQRQSIKFNGVPYIVQRAAEAALSPAGIKQCGEQVAYYLENAKILAEFLEARGAQFYGGVNSPYIWLRCPEGETSWGYFDRLLHEFQIVVTPGAGFGSCGEGYVRLSAFAPREDILEVIKRLGKNIWKV